MSECTYGDEIYSTFSIVADSIKGDTSTRLCLIAMIHKCHSTARIFYAEVVEHNAIHASMTQHSFQFIEISHFYLYLQVEVLLLEISMTILK